MIRILHIINDLRASSGGAPKAVLELAEALDALGVSNVVLFGDAASPRADTTRLNKTAVQLLAVPLLGPTGIGIPGGVRALSTAIEAADLVILHGIYQGLVVAAATLSRLLKKPYFVMPHCSTMTGVRRRKRLRNGLIDLLYHRAYVQHAAGLIFTNKIEAENSEKPPVPGLPEIILPLGVYSGEYKIQNDSCAVAEQYDIPKDHRIGLFLSRVTWKKGLQPLLQAFRAADLASPTTLILAGPVDREMLALVQRSCHDAPPDRQIRAIGAVNAEQRDQLYSAAAFSILPSYSENYGYAAVESLLYGTPLIVSQGVAIWERLQSTGGALICDPSAESIQAAMEDLEQQGVEVSGGQLRQRASVEFSWQSQTPGLLNAVASLKAIANAYHG